ncbi:MAG TPA: N-acetylglucosamine-6-phosphate deacetylase [Solirubrobacterales bacterium]|jgi:N-acetylglucosamine-6-phosphate deacetylase
MRLGVAAALVGGELVDGDVEVVDERVATLGLGAPSGSRIAAPGFVDLQVNGYAGVDFSAPGADGYEVARAALLAGGVTAFQPTIVTAEVDSMLASLAQMPAPDLGSQGVPVGRSVAAASGPRVIGAHLEGPFISPSRRGAHDPSAICPPDLAILRALLDGGTPTKASLTAEVTGAVGASLPNCAVTQVTLAPELPGALELIDELVARGITVACGHTDADAAAAHLAFDHGANAVTHLFNAMRRPTPRDPGIAFAALARDDVFVSLIVDGNHLADDTVRTAWRAAGDRVVLISDAVAAAGAPDGDYALGGAVPTHSGGGVVRTTDGALAGSTLSMLDAVRNAHALGIPLAAALRAATETPARMARRPDLGRIEPGARADLVVLDDSLELQQVLLDGAICG